MLPPIPTTATLPLYRHLATALDAYAACMTSTANPSQKAWAPHWEGYIRNAEAELPRGSGFDRYPTIDLDASRENAIVIIGSYHKMDARGMYAGWEDYTVLVQPDLISGIRLSIQGVGQAEFNDYIYECFRIALMAQFPDSAFHAKAEAQG